MLNKLYPFNFKIIYYIGKLNPTNLLLRKLDFISKVRKEKVITI
jgi:hypothetical protein